MLSCFLKKPTALIFASLFLLHPSETHAYFDPGTGSIILQLLMASILGFLFTLKMYWKQFKAFLKNLFSKNGADD